MKGKNGIVSCVAAECFCGILAVRACRICEQPRCETHSPLVYPANAQFGSNCTRCSDRYNQEFQEVKSALDAERVSLASVPRSELLARAWAEGSKASAFKKDSKHYKLARKPFAEVAIIATWEGGTDMGSWTEAIGITRDGQAYSGVLRGKALEVYFRRSGLSSVPQEEIEATQQLLANALAESGQVGRRYSEFLRPGHFALWRPTS